MEKAKVLHIVEAFGGGVYTMVSSLLCRTCDEFDTYLLCSLRPQTPPNYREQLDSRIHIMEMQHAGRKIGWGDLLNFVEIRRIVKKINPDIIHLHSAKSGFIGRWAINMTKYQVLYTPHGYPFLKLDDPVLRRKIYYYLEKAAAKKGGFTICCSKGEWEISRKVTLNSMYINNGIELQQKNFPEPRFPNLDSDSFKIATMGRICVQKQPHRFQQIAVRHPGHHFLWIGDGELREELQSDNIEITGWTDQNDALKCLNESDIFVLLSAWEGLPIALLEAMYLKKICIVAPIPGMREVICDGEDGFLCDSAERFAEILQGIQSGKYDWRKIARNAQETVKRRFTAEQMANSYKALYRKLLHGGK